MRTEHTLQPGIRDIHMDRPATPADWINALHLKYGEVRALRINIGEVASLIGCPGQLRFLSSSADWVRESLTAADNMLTHALAIERTAVRSAMEIHNKYSCSVNDAIAPFIKITESTRIISIFAVTRVKLFKHLPVYDEDARVAVDHFLNIAESATRIAQTAHDDITTLRKGGTRVPWLMHLNSPPAGYFQRAL